MLDLIEQIFNIGGNWGGQLSKMGSTLDQIDGKFGSISRGFSIFNSLLLGGAFALGIDHIVKLNKALEDTKMRLAGSIGAAGFTKNFNDSLVLTNALMRQNREEAARLPGSEAQFMQG